MGVCGFCLLYLGATQRRASMSLTHVASFLLVEPLPSSSQLLSHCQALSSQCCRALWDLLRRGSAGSRMTCVSSTGLGDCRALIFTYYLTLLCRGG